AAVVVERLLVRPAAGQEALEIGADDPFVALLESWMQLQDRLARATDQASRLAVRHGHVAADEIERELHDHANTAKAPPLENRRADFHRRIHCVFAHAQLPRSNGDAVRRIPDFVRGYRVSAVGCREASTRENNRPRSTTFPAAQLAQPKA